MSQYYGIAPTPPRLSPFWRTLVSRLDGQPHPTFLSTDDDATSPVGAETQPWARGVVVPVRRLWGETVTIPGRFRLVSFLIRYDQHPPGGTPVGIGPNDYDPMVPLEVAHETAFARIHGWKPTGLNGVVLNRPIWRYTDPQSAPLWDDDQGVWFLSAEYRAWLAPA